MSPSKKFPDVSVMKDSSIIACVFVKTSWNTCPPVSSSNPKPIGS